MSTVVIMRGLPGSGKSEFAFRWLGAARLPPIFSTDDYWREFKVPFNRADLSRAHRWNLDRYGAALARGEFLVVVDNTNIKKEHFRPYVDHAKAMGYQVVTTDSSTADDRVLAGRNAHGVPVEKIRAMREAFECSCREAIDMPQDYGPCGKCGSPMRYYSHVVYQITWNGKPVCGECADELRKATKELDSK